MKDEDGNSIVEINRNVIMLYFVLLSRLFVDRMDKNMP
jgi:hypothetical protein